MIQGREFTMGSPAGERGRSQEEVQHRVRIARTYAIATTEVTNEQFARFLMAQPKYASRWRAATAVRFGDPPRITAFSPTPDSPQVAVGWYDAAQYCNWLSEQGGLPRDQWVYPDNIDAERGLDLPANYLHRSGYRLLTEPSGSSQRGPERRRAAISAMTRQRCRNTRGMTRIAVPERARA
jgi:hypothetical protein